MQKHGLLVLGALLVSSSVANAANPADVSGGLRYWPGTFVKAVKDDPSHFLFVSHAPTKDVVLAVTDWHSDVSAAAYTELSVMRKVSPDLQVGLKAVIGTGGQASSQGLLLDYRQRNWSLAAILPLDADQPLLIGPRYTKGHYTAFALISPEAKDLYGVSYYGPEWWVEGTVGRKAAFFRVSKRIRSFYPEVRLRKIGGVSSVGVGLGWIGK